MAPTHAAPAAMPTAPLTLAQCLIWYLPPTMGYLYDQFMTLGPERSVVFAARPLEPGRFPFDRLYLAPASGDWRQLSPQGRLLSSAFHRLWRPIVQEERVALLHVHDGRLAPSFLSLARDLDLPLVTTFLGRDVSAHLDDAGYRVALQQLFDAGTLFTVMSQAMARQVERLGCPATKIRVIPHGIPLNRFPFAPRRAPAQGPVILLTAGRLIPKKGPEVLAQAFVRLCEQGHDVMLRVIGDGEQRPWMAAIFTGAGVSKRVQFLGWQPPETVAAEMAGAHLFSLPSHVGPDGDAEGVPNVLKEAMASGMPVVSTRHAGIPELVEDGISGYLVPEGDVEALADRLERLLNEPERWEAMGQAGRTTIEAGYSLDSVVNRLETEVYRPLLGETLSPVPPGGRTLTPQDRSDPHGSPTHR